MKLYRGQLDRCSLRLPSWIRNQLPLEVIGRWFTDDVKIAQWYIEEAAPNGVLIVVDVPDEVAEASWLPNQPKKIQLYSKDINHEFFLPREWAERARPEQ
jgi:hypothetical protein